MKQGSFVMPKNAPTGLTGWKKQIREYCDTNGIHKTDSQVSRMATKAHKRQQAEPGSDRFDFYDAMRILGVLTDSTARDAVRNMEDANHWRVAL